MTEKLSSITEHPPVADDVYTELVLVAQPHDDSSEAWEAGYNEQEKIIARNNEKRFSPEVERLVQKSIIDRAQTIIGDLGTKGLAKKGQGALEGKTATAKANLSKELSTLLEQLGFKDAKQAFIWGGATYSANEGRSTGSFYTVVLSNGQERFDDPTVHGYRTGSDELASLIRELPQDHNHDPSFNRPGRDMVVIHPNRQFFGSHDRALETLSTGSAYNVALDLVLDSIQTQQAIESTQFPDRFNS